MIDPHQRYFSGSSTHSWNVAKKGDLLDTLTDQFEVKLTKTSRPAPMRRRVPDNSPSTYCAVVWSLQC